jgi:secondary thiamine-phosphate synthase enzyme
MHTMHITTTKPREVLDITDLVEKSLAVSGGSGLVTVFVAHTTTAVTTADLDPGTDLDLLDALHGMLPKLQWRHPHNPEHAPAHLLASIVGPSLSVPYSDGKLLLGTWQRIVLLEFDGPKERKLYIVP